MYKQMQHRFQRFLSLMARMTLGDEFQVNVKSTPSEIFFGALPSAPFSSMVQQLQALLGRPEINKVKTESKSSFWVDKVRITNACQ